MPPPPPSPWPAWAIVRARSSSGTSIRSGSGSGRSSRTWSRASSRRRKPVPPASTTPASLSTGSMSGVRARASAPWAFDRSSTSTSDPPPSAADGPGLRRLADHGQDRALDRRAHRAVGRRRRLGQRPGPRRAVGLVPLGQDGGQAPQDLAEDHPAVAAGAHERAVADGLAGVGHRRAGALELGDHRLEGQGHVGAGVTVGDGVDVETVDRVLVRPQEVAEGGDRRPQVVSAEELAGRHGGRW